MDRFLPHSLLLLIALLPLGLIHAQSDSHRITDEERLLMPAYLQSMQAEGITTPPNRPVRASAEWEEIDALLITWTSYTSILKEIVRHAQAEARVVIVCADSNTVKTYLINNNVPTANVSYLIAPYNSIWMRDYGPWNIYTDDVDTLALVDWIYNRPRPKDDTLNSSISNFEALPLYQTTLAPYNLIHTGGNFMTDGFGTGFSSNLILNENPGLSTAQIDTIMRRFMGIDRYVRMTTLPYDDIHHIDMHLKLLDEETLLVGQYPTGVADGPQIEANLQYILANYNSVYGTPYKVVRIPMPPDAGGDYPNTGGDYRTYTNAVFVNKTVLVPGYAQQYDTTARRIWQEALPGYNIQFINCNAIIPALGALHCITKEVATRDPLLISHQPLSDTYDSQNAYTVQARIQHRSGIALATLYYRTDTSLPYLAVPMTLTNPTLNLWTGQIPAQAAGTKIDYYVSAEAVSGKQQVRPLPAPAGFWQFEVLNFVAIAEELKGTALLPAYPNPSQGITCIPATFNEAGWVKVALTDMPGRSAYTIYEGNVDAGPHNFFVQTQLLATGVYVISMQSEQGHWKQKLMVR